MNDEQFKKLVNKEVLIQKIVDAVEQIYNETEFVRTVDEDGTPYDTKELNLSFTNIAEVAGLTNLEIEAIARTTPEERAQIEALVTERLGPSLDDIGPTTDEPSLMSRTQAETIHFDWNNINYEFAFQTFFARGENAPNNEFYEDVRIPAGYSYGDPRNTRVNLGWTVPTAHDVEDYVRRTDPEGFARFGIARRQEGQQVTPFLEALRHPEEKYPNDREMQRALIEYAHTNLIEFKQSRNLRFGLDGPRSRNTIPELAQHMTDPNNEYGRRMLQKIAESGPEYMALAKYDGVPMTADNIVNPGNATDLFTHCATNAGEQRLVQVMRLYNRAMGRIDATNNPAEKERIFNEFLETPADAVFKYTKVLTNGVPVEIDNLTIFDVMHIMGTVEEPKDGSLQYKITVKGITPLEPLPLDPEVEVPPREIELKEPEPEEPEEKKSTLGVFSKTDVMPTQSWGDTTPEDYTTAVHGVTYTTELNENVELQAYAGVATASYQSSTAMRGLGTYVIDLPTGLDGEVAGVYIGADGEPLRDQDGRTVLGFGDDRPGYAFQTDHPALEDVRNYDLGQFCLDDKFKHVGAAAGIRLIITPENGVESFTIGADGKLYEDGFSVGGQIGTSFYLNDDTQNTLVGVNAEASYTELGIETSGTHKGDIGGYTANHTKSEEVPLEYTDREIQPLTELVEITEDRVPLKKIKEKEPLFEVEEQKVQKMMPMVPRAVWNDVDNNGSCAWSYQGLISLEEAIEHQNYIEDVLANGPPYPNGNPLYGDSDYNSGTLSLPYIPQELVSPASTLWEWQAVTPTEYITKAEADNIEVLPGVIASIPDNLRVYEWFALTNPMTQAEFDALDPDCYQMISNTPVAWQLVDPENLLTYDEAVALGIPPNEFEWVVIAGQFISVDDANAGNIPYDDPNDIVSVVIDTQLQNVTDPDGNQLYEEVSSTTTTVNSQHVRGMSIDHMIAPDGTTIETVGDPTMTDLSVSGNIGLSTRLNPTSSISGHVGFGYRHLSFPDVLATQTYIESHDVLNTEQLPASFADPANKDDVLITNPFGITGLQQGDHTIVPGAFLSNTDGSLSPQDFAAQLLTENRQLEKWEVEFLVNYRKAIQEGRLQGGVLTVGTNIGIQQFTYSEDQTLTIPGGTSMQSITNRYNAASGALSVGYSKDGYSVVLSGRGTTVNGGPLQFGGAEVKVGIPLGAGKTRDQIEKTTFDLTSPGLSVDPTSVEYSPHVAPMGTEQDKKDTPPAAPAAPITPGGN